MPDDSVSGSGTYNGNLGQLIFESTHNDIDESEVIVQVFSGRVRVYLQERIWSQWYQAINQITGQDFHQSRNVDSGMFDGDHRLRVWARADNTSVNVQFSSYDW